MGCVFNSRQFERFGFADLLRLPVFVVVQSIAIAHVSASVHRNKKFEIQNIFNLKSGSA
jgi:hypothetical protein